jgi:hypothetical protein
VILQVWYIYTSALYRYLLFFLSLFLVSTYTSNCKLFCVSVAFFLTVQFIVRKFLVIPVFTEDKVITFSISELIYI